MSTHAVFRVGDRLLALPIEAVSEVFRMVAVTARPPRARHLLGIVDCRGQLLPLVDLGARLGLSPPRTEAALVDGHVLVVRDAVGLVGYAVDEVRELAEGELEPLPAAARPLVAFVQGAVRLPDGTVAPLLDPPVLLTARARHDLKLALAQLGEKRS